MKGNCHPRHLTSPGIRLKKISNRTVGPQIKSYCTGGKKSQSKPLVEITTWNDKTSLRPTRLFRKSKTDNDLVTADGGLGRKVYSYL